MRVTWATVTAEVTREDGRTEIVSLELPGGDGVQMELLSNVVYPEPEMDDPRAFADPHRYTATLPAPLVDVWLSWRQARSAPGPWLIYRILPARPVLPAPVETDE